MSCPTWIQNSVKFSHPLDHPGLLLGHKHDGRVEGRSLLPAGRHPTRHCQRPWELVRTQHGAPDLKQYEVFCVGEGAFQAGHQGEVIKAGTGTIWVRIMRRPQRIQGTVRLRTVPWRIIEVPYRTSVAIRNHWNSTRLQIRIHTQEFYDEEIKNVVFKNYLLWNKYYSIPVLYRHSKYFLGLHDNSKPNEKPPALKREKSVPVLTWNFYFFLS